MIFGYVRVSTQDQDVENQKNAIREFCEKKRIIIDEWIEIEISSRKSTEARRIDELLSKLNQDDVVVTSELSRLGRSTREAMDIIESIVSTKKARLILIKQGLDLDLSSKDNMANKVSITIFSMIAELERDLISQRTKEALRVRVMKGVKLGKPVGTIQESIYDKDENKIFHFLELGVSAKKISSIHLQYGTDQSLRDYIRTRWKKHYEKEVGHDKSKII